MEGFSRITAAIALLAGAEGRRQVSRKAQMAERFVPPVVLALVMQVGVFAAGGEKMAPTGNTGDAVSSYADAAGRFPVPGTKRFYLQQPCDYKIVQGRPDLKFQIKSAIQPEYPTGYGFVLLRDDRPVSFDFERTRQRFVDDALPMVRQTIAQDGFVFEQEAFTTVAEGRPLLMVRLRVAPEGGNAGRSLRLAWLTTRQPHDRYHSHPNEDYIVFEPWAPAWEHGIALDERSDCLYSGKAIAALFHHTDNVSIGGPGRSPGRLPIALSFAAAKEAAITISIPYEGVQQPADKEDTGLRWRADKAFLRGDEPALAAVSFENQYEEQRRHWQQRLQQATAILVPEPIVGQIYRTLTLGDLQFLGGAPGVNHLRPGQGGFNDFSVVYGWESSHYLTVMDKQGFHDEVRRALDFFLTTQQGDHGPA